MRFRQGPLTEASIIYLVATVFSFVTLLIANMFDFGSTVGAYTLEAMVTLLPAWTLWAITGLFTKTKSAMVRFITQTVVSGVVAAIALVAVKQLLASLESQPTEQATQILYLILSTFVLGSIIGSIFTNFYVLRRIQAGEPIFSKPNKKGSK